MKTCPQCGHENPASAEVCAECSSPLDPPVREPPAPARADEPPPAVVRRPVREYLIGAAVGLIPAISLMLGVKAGSSGAGGQLVGIAGFGFVALILAAIIVLAFTRWRYAGYGLLTMVFVGPVVAAIGCAVILSHR